MMTRTAMRSTGTVGCVAEPVSTVRSVDLDGTLVAAGHQPEYLPYLGFLAKMFESDVFVILDHVQFEKPGWQSRNRILGKSGVVVLSVPVRTKGRFEQCISEVEIAAGEVWRRKHWRSIRAAYQDAPGFKEHGAFFEWVYGQPWESLLALNMAVITYLRSAFTITTPVIYSSGLDLGTVRKTELLIAICKATGCGAYLSGRGAAVYLDEERLGAAGIEARFTGFNHPVYNQGEHPFVPNMSALDMLFRHPHSAPRLLADSLDVSRGVEGVWR